MYNVIYLLICAVVLSVYVYFCLRGKKMSNKEHYHYLVSYSFEAKDNNFGFGNMEVTTDNKISNIHINKLREKVLEGAREHNDKINNTSIISISPLECGCTEEEIENARE